MTQTSPRVFWEEYCEALRAAGTRAAYASDSAWTRVACGAAETVCTKLGLLVQREYLRLDVMGYRYRVTDDCYDWDLRVAFEHENCCQKGKDWTAELCKLTHVVADLRVLVGYFKHRAGRLEETLQRRVNLMGDRMNRVSASRWLFVFGPSMPRPGEAFRAFTIDERLMLQPLRDQSPLVPLDFPEE